MPKPDRRDLYRKALRAEDDPPSIVASGGLCAPMIPFYSLPSGAEVTIVREMLPGFKSGLRITTRRGPS